METYVRKGQEAATLQAQLWTFLITPVVGGLIGWVTNILAIKMIFHPREPIRIPLTPWKIHGLLPKRKAELARSVGKTVSQELLPMDQLLEQFDYASYKKDIIRTVLSHVDHRLTNTLPKFIPANLRHILREFVSDLIGKEANQLLDKALGKIKEKVVEEVDIETIVEDQILSLDIVRLEGLVIGIAKNELRHIEVLGAVLGFVIGILQAALMIVLA